MARIKVTEKDIEKISSNPVSSSKTEEAKSSSSSYDELLKELDDISKKYEFALSPKDTVETDINLERKTFRDVSDEDLKKQAEDSLIDYKQTSTKRINDENKSVIDNLSNQKISETQDAEISKTNTNNYYDTAKENAENDALKRGLSRSSIIINTLSAFDQNRINKLNAIDKDLTAKIDSINDQIDLLNLEKEKALNDFDINYASKLNSKIKELKEELQTRKDEVVEYNNKITQIEKEYKNNAIDFNNDAKSQAYSELLERAEFFIDNGKKLNENLQKENYVAIKDFLSNLSVSEAIEMLSNNSFLKEMLGNQYISLLTYFKLQGR